MAGVLFGGSQLNRNSRVAIGGRLGDLIAFARFLPKDAVANTLRFLVGGAAHLHVALQGGTAPPPLRLDRPLVLYVSRTASGTPCPNCLAENTTLLVLFALFAPLFCGFLPFAQRRFAAQENKCRSWQGKAPVRPRCQGRGVGVHRSEAQSLDRRCGRIRRRVRPGRAETGRQNLCCNTTGTTFCRRRRSWMKEELPGPLRRFL